MSEQKKKLNESQEKEVAGGRLQDPTLPPPPAIPGPGALDLPLLLKLKKTDKCHYCGKALGCAVTIDYHDRLHLKECCAECKNKILKRYGKEEHN